MARYPLRTPLGYLVGGCLRSMMRAMPTYQLFCRTCDVIYEHHTSMRDYEVSRDTYRCPECDTPLGNKFSFAVMPSMPDHYNHTVGKYVLGRKSFRDELKRKSDEVSARTGIAHNFQPVDLNDREALGVTDEGLNSTYDRARREGREHEVRAWQ